MSDPERLQRFLRTDPSDAGCNEAMAVLRISVDLAAAGQDAAGVLPPGTPLTCRRAPGAAQVAALVSMRWTWPGAFGCRTAALRARLALPRAGCGDSVGILKIATGACVIFVPRFLRFCRQEG